MTMSSLNSEPLVRLGSDAHDNVRQAALEELTRLQLPEALPVAYDALTVVVNPNNTWVKSLTIADLKTMWEPSAQGRVSSWKQV